jgi:hypothetical protein
VRTVNLRQQRLIDFRDSRGHRLIGARFKFAVAAQFAAVERRANKLRCHFQASVQSFRAGRLRQVQIGELHASREAPIGCVCVGHRRGGDDESGGKERSKFNHRSLLEGWLVTAHSRRGDQVSCAEFFAHCQYWIGGARDLGNVMECSAVGRFVIEVAATRVRREKIIATRASFAARLESIQSRRQFDCAIRSDFREKSFYLRANRADRYAANSSDCFRRFTCR